MHAGYINAILLFLFLAGAVTTVVVFCLKLEACNRLKCLEKICLEIDRSKWPEGLRAKFDEDVATFTAAIVKGDDPQNIRYQLTRHAETCKWMKEVQKSCLKCIADFKNETRGRVSALKKRGIPMQDMKSLQADVQAVHEFLGEFEKVCWSEKALYEKGGVIKEIGLDIDRRRQLLYSMLMLHNIVAGQIPVRIHNLYQHYCQK